MRPGRKSQQEEEEARRAEKARQTTRGKAKERTMRREAKERQKACKGTGKYADFDSGREQYPFEMKMREVSDWSRTKP